MPVDAASGVVLGLCFALLWLRRPGALLLVVGLQSVAIAGAALALGRWPVALVQAGWGVCVLPLLLSRAARRWIILPVQLRPGQARPWALTLAAALLGLACLPIHRMGPALAVVLPGALAAIAQPGPLPRIIGFTALQSGITLAGLASGAGPLLLAGPLLPALALGGLVFRPSRTLIPALRWAEFAGCALLFLLCCALPWFGTLPWPFRADAQGLFAAILISAVVTLLRWPSLTAGQPVPTGVMLLIGALLAVLAAAPGLAWIGLAVCIAAVALNAPRRNQRLAGLALGLTLLGFTLLPAAPLVAEAGLMAGFACLALLGAELASLGVLLVLRLPMAPHAGDLDPLLLAAGLAAMLAGAAPLLVRMSPGRTAPLAALGQAGAVVFALGLNTPAGHFAAVVQCLLLVLTRAGIAASGGTGWPRLAAMAGLAGVPPFGVFAGLLLILSATAARAPLLLVPFLAGWAGIAWPLLRDLPPAAGKFRPDLAWLPLALALLFGLAMPAPLADGLRLVAGSLP